MIRSNFSNNESGAAAFLARFGTGLASGLGLGLGLGLGIGLGLGVGLGLRPCLDANIGSAS